MPLFLFASTLHFLTLILKDDNAPAVYITLYFLLAACYFGFGALSNRMVVFVAFRILGIAVDGIFAFLKALIMLPARVVRRL